VNPLIKAASRNALRTGVILFAFALVATALLVVTFTRTEPTIERSKQAEKLALLRQVLPPALYDNDLIASQQSVPPDELLGTRQPSVIWIARRDEAVTAVVLEAIATDGYSGNIHLVIGIDIRRHRHRGTRHLAPRNPGTGRLHRSRQERAGSSSSSASR
jgi:Na+-translocating ferredoxin:NAD+ oxidoreductase subunit G